MDETKIVKAQYYPGGVDLTIADLTPVHTVRVCVTKVVEGILKKGHQSYITLKDQLLPKEIIQVGDYDILYKIVTLPKAHRKGGWTHKIIRVDGYNITQHDINGTREKQRVLIKSRESFQQIFARANFYPDSK